MKNKLKISLTLLCGMVIGYGCASAQKTSFQIIDGVNLAQQTAWTEYTTYRSQAVVSSSTDSNVVKAFNSLQAAELAAVDISTNGGTFNATTIDQDLSDIVNLLTTSGVKVSGVTTNF